MTLMLSWLQVVLITLLILLIITQTVSIRIKYDKCFIFDCDFTLVSFTFIPDKKKKNKKAKSMPLGIRSIIKVVDYALSKSQLQITAIPLLPPDNNHPLIYGYSEFFRYIALSYLDKKAISVSYLEAGSPEHLLDINFKISFYHLVSTLVLYLKECRKTRQRVRVRL